MLNMLWAGMMAAGIFWAAFHGNMGEVTNGLLDSYEGSLPFNDKAAPEVIAHETGMSKNEFKRAVGHLLKEGKIQITEKNIRRVRG